MFDDKALAELLAAWPLQPPVRLTRVLPGGTTSEVWRVGAANGTFAAKLVHDEQRFVEPGLRVAAAVAAAGVCAGAPVPTEDGEFAAPVTSPSGQRLTLAVLQWCEGQPLDTAEPSSPSAAGDLLGRVHAALAATNPRPEVPGDLLEWFGGFLASSDDDDARRALEVARELADRGALTMGVVYGDPSPEVLVLTNGELALIDWGTPSFGPLLHDVCVWKRAFASDDAGERRFLAAYREHAAIEEHEYAHIDSFTPLVRSLLPR